MSVERVIAGRQRWHCDQSDALEWLRALPDDSVDLLITSPPYEAARTYSIGFNLRGQAWVDWMVSIVAAAAPKVKGLIAVNCEGQTRNYKYSATPFLLAADLHRAGFNLRKPVVYERDGVPGSGGPDWLKNRWEPILCVTRAGELPWHHNIACGKPAIWHAGGVSNNRKADGTRKPAPKYAKPEIANPGNVLSLSSGGGHLGAAIAHDNEAPFPLDLPAFFIKSFCPPGGIVCDPFSGSGTTCHAAVENGRRFIGCDIRESQVNLCARRMRSVTPSFAEAAS